MNNSDQTIGQLLKLGCEILTAEDNPRLESEILLSHVLDCSRTSLHAWPEKIIADLQVQQYQELLTRRQQGEPIAYITGNREFWSLELKVNSSTLIPRPETECLVELVLKNNPRDQNLKIADLGTGSGAIAIALAHECPNWTLHGFDKSESAVAIARENAKRHGLSNVEFFHYDWSEPWEHGEYNIFCSNPPYIAPNDPHIEQGDLRYEPKSALIAEDFGLQDIRQIANLAYINLPVGGSIYLEHGADQASAVLGILNAAKFNQVDDFKDYSNKPRIAFGQK